MDFPDFFDKAPVVMLRDPLAAFLGAAKSLERIFYPPWALPAQSHATLRRLAKFCQNHSPRLSVDRVRLGPARQCPARRRTGYHA